MDNNEKNINYYAIVVGDWHHNSLGIIRSLGEKNVPVYFINTSDSGYGDFSKYTCESYHIRSESEMLNVINQIVEEVAGVPVLFPAGDTAALYIDNNYETLKNICICPGLHGKSEFFMNKKIMGEYAEKAGFNVPKSQVIDLQKKENIQIKFPVIIKPLKSVDGSKSDIEICQDSECLSDIFTKLKKDGYDEILIQEFVDGKENFIIGYNGCKVPGKPAYLYGELKKIREFPPGRGSTSYAHIAKEITTVSETIIDRFLDDVGFDGIFDVDIKVIDGTPYFLEINFRNGGLSYAFTSAGFNIPYTWFCLKTGCMVDTPQIREINLICERDDLKNLQAHNISVFKWIKDVRNANSAMLFNRSDPEPFVKAYGKIFSVLFDLMFNRRRND